MALDNVVLREKLWHNKRLPVVVILGSVISFLSTHISLHRLPKRFTSLQLVSNSRVLDVGCGRGIDRATMFINEGCYYVGVDISDECVSAI